MLAQNFKTPADLGISDSEFEALVKVLGMLERGEIKSTPPHPKRTRKYSLYVSESESPPTHFYMGCEIVHYECGTACCILGWARFVGQDDMMFRDATCCDHSAQSLFYPMNGGIDVRRTEVGAMALRNYLTHGEPHWDEALAE